MALIRPCIYIQQFQMIPGTYLKWKQEAVKKMPPDDQ